MKSAGHSLYEQYTQTLLDLQNCECEDWGALTPEEQQVWEELARRIRFEPS